MEEHLRQCSACRDDWQTWREIAALEIPATPVALHGRILEALSLAQRQKPERRFRPFVVGGVVLGGLAAAAAIVAWNNASTPVPQAVVRDTRPAAPETRAAPDAVPAEPPGEPAAEVVEAADATRDAPEEKSANALRFLVVFRPETGADPQAIASASQCHDAVVNHLRAVPQFQIIAPGTASSTPGTLSGLPDSDRQMARVQGAAHVLVVSTEMGCEATLRDAETGNLVPGGAGGQLLAFEGYGPSAAGLTQRLREQFLSDAEALWAEASRRVLDTRLSEQERVGALWSFGEYRSRSPSLARRPLDSEVIAAAARLATASADPRVRQSIWAVLRGVRHKELIEPLLKALSSDGEPAIRMQAAFSLRSFLEEPGVRDALLRAAAEDPDSVPEVTCCVYTVREAAERAAVPDDQFTEWVHAKLLDEGLPVRSRLRHLVPSSMDGRFLFLRDVEFGAAAARVVFELGRQAQDPEIRLMAWDILGHAPADASFIPQFISDLADHPDEYVRANAAKQLFRHTGHPEASKALEAARNDPSGQVRIAASGAQRPFRR